MLSFVWRYDSLIPRIQLLKLLDKVSTDYHAYNTHPSAIYSSGHNILEIFKMF